VVRATLGRLIAALFRTRVTGAAHVPASGVILAGNHISYADPVLLWCRSPRPTHFMAKAELWDSWLMAWGLDHFWAFPVKRGEADRGALVTAGALLKAGEPVGIFPEGTRNLDGSAEAQQGAAFLAIRNGVPVVPIGIAGTDRILPPGSRMLRFPTVTISFGEPIDPAEFVQEKRGERVQAMTARIMDGIGEQLGVAREEQPE
jgi:1-acyl-sn-glycerol-3-phosphate acyltransferase